MTTGSTVVLHPRAPTTSPARAVIWGAGIGNSLEWYDFASYAIFAPFFAPQFFNPAAPTSALLSTLAVFAVGFFLRPVGGLFFGWLADRQGRRYAMIVSMSITACGCLLVAVSPPFARIGLLAPILLVTARLAQGFGLGGEIGASFTFLVESAPPERRGLWASSMFIAISGGSLLATIVGLILTGLLPKAAMQTYGWRIPFFIGALLGVYALFLRSRLTETAAFREELREERKSGVRPTLWRSIRQNRRAILMVIGLTAGPTLSYNTWISGATTYAINFHRMKPQAALWALMIGLLIYILIQPLWGLLSDRIGRKPNLLIGSAVSAVIAVPLIGMIDNRFGPLVLGIGLAMAVLAAWTAIAPAVYAEMFPTSFRATGMAIPYSLTVAVFGGTAPYLQSWLANQGRMSVFAGYVVVLNLLTVSTILFMPETKGKPLE